MRKTLLAAVALAAMVASGDARAAELPKQMLGKWCQVGHTPSSYNIFTRGTCPVTRDKFGVPSIYFQVYPDGYVSTTEGEGEPLDCKFQRVLHLSSGEYYIKFSCVIEKSEIKDAEATLQIRGRKLILINLAHGHNP